MTKAVCSLGLALLLAGSAHAADTGWRWTWQALRGAAATSGTASYVFHMPGSKTIRPTFVASQLRNFTVLIDDGHGIPFYVLSVEISGTGVSATADELDQDARPPRHFTGSFRQQGGEDVITLTSGEDEQIVLHGNPPSR